MKLIKSILLPIVLLCLISCNNKDLNNNSSVNSEISISIPTYTKKDIDKFNEEYEYEGSIENNDVFIKKYNGEEKDVIVPYFVSSIGSSAFSNNCLENLTLHNNLKKVGSSTFKGCKNLKNLYFNGKISDWCNIEFLDEYSNPLFYVENFYLPDKNNEWKLVTDIEIPDTTTNIGKYQFITYNKINNLTLSASIENIYELAFYDCTEIENVYYKGTLEQWSKINIFTKLMIGRGDTASGSPLKYAKHFFVYDENNEFYEVKSIEITDGKTRINKYSTFEYKYIKDIIIPDSIITIDEKAFYEYDSLENVYYKGTIEQWCKIDFSDNPMIYAEHFYLLDKNNEWYEVTSIEIPETISEIKNYTFYGFDYLTNVKMSNNVTIIGSYAFKDCTNLKEIVLSDNVTVLKYEAFENCVNLEEIILTKNLKDVASNVFKNCTSLREITILNRFIGFDSEAFEGCINLENVYFKGKVFEWNSMSLQGSADPMYYAKHFYILDSNNEWIEVTDQVK